MKKIGLKDNGALVPQHLNNAINLKMTYAWARRLEIVLDLPEFSLVKMVGNPTPVQWKAIKEIKPKCIK